MGQRGLVNGLTVTLRHARPTSRAGSLFAPERERGITVEGIRVLLHLQAECKQITCAGASKWMAVYASNAASTAAICKQHEYPVWTN